MSYDIYPMASTVVVRLTWGDSVQGEESHSPHPALIANITQSIWLPPFCPSRHEHSNVQELAKRDSGPDGPPSTPADWCTLHWGTNCPQYPCGIRQPSVCEPEAFIVIITLHWGTTWFFLLKMLYSAIRINGCTLWCHCSQIGSKDHKRTFLLNICSQENKLFIAGMSFVLEILGELLKQLKLIILSK